MTFGGRHDNVTDNLVLVLHLVLERRQVRSTVIRRGHERVLFRGRIGDFLLELSNVPDSSLLVFRSGAALVASTRRRFPPNELRPQRRLRPVHHELGRNGHVPSVQLVMTRIFRQDVLMVLLECCA